MSNTIWIDSEKKEVDGYESSGQFGDWESINMFLIKGAYHHDTFGGEKFNVGFDVKPGMPVYAVYMSYDTGDSFGRSEGEGEILWVFSDPHLAKNAANHIKNQEDQHSIEFETESGKMVKISNPGFGYFEHVNEVDVKPLVVM